MLAGRARTAQPLAVATTPTRPTANNGLGTRELSWNERCLEEMVLEREKFELLWLILAEGISKMTLGCDGRIYLVAQLRHN